MNRSEATTKSELQLRWVFLLMATVVIVMSFLMNVVGTDQVYLPGLNLPLPESCGSRLMFGIDCPACGLTRAFISISHGKFLNAWLFNPASFLTYLFVAVQIPWQLFQLHRLKNNKPRIDQQWIYYLPTAVFVALILQWLVRLVGPGIA